MFDSVVSECLQFYVYRLIDPRCGQTFYVGKGTGNRMFDHVKGAIDPETALQSMKLDRIYEIQAKGLEVIYVVHRHGIRSEAVAYEIEAAVIDAYSGLTNAVLGHGSSLRGPSSPEDLIEIYNAPFIEANHHLLAVGVSRTYGERSYYDSARFAWKLKLSNAQRLEGVLAIERGLVRAAFRPTTWLPATRDNFPELAGDISDRLGFIGSEDPELERQYLNKRLPLDQRLSQHGIRYLNPK